MARANPTRSNLSDGAKPRQTRLTRFTQRRPITAFALAVFAVGWPMLAIPVIAGLPVEPFLLIATLVGLLGSALVVTRVTAGPGAIRQLLSRVLIWRFSPGRWAVIVLAMPVLTVALAAASGTFESPAGGWGSVAATYLFDVFLIAALINLWEETAWGGFVQSRLMERHGLLVGSLLTAPLFAGIHLPLQFESGWTWSKAAFGFAVVVASAPFYRYLVGMHLLATGGSILAIGIQHASWNAAGKLEVVDGDWQALAAAVLLTVLVAAGGRLRGRESSPMAGDAEEAAAADWTAPRTLVAGSRGRA